MNFTCYGKLQAWSLLLAGMLLLPVSSAIADAPNESIGQQQLPGAVCQFGVVYSLQNGFNFSILSARYSVEPFMGVDILRADKNEKLIVLEIACKNILKTDNTFSPRYNISLVDEKGTLYGFHAISYGLFSKGSDSNQSLSLHPGQGLGQPALKDPLRVAFEIPAKLRIVKVMVNWGRAGHPQEKVLRYAIAGATKEEAGLPGDPKNIIAALPDTVRDPADNSGAVALDEGKGAVGVEVPSGFFSLRLDGVTYTTEPILNGQAPRGGKQYAVATVTVKNLTDQTQRFNGLIVWKDNELTDSDGERTNPEGFRKTKKDEEPSNDLQQGEEYTMRIIFIIDKEVTAKKLVLKADGGRKWAYDIMAAK